MINIVFDCRIERR